jgi:hypothetical protein
MAQQLINIGTSANAGNGDPIRTAGNKINSNFTELYSRVPYSLPIATEIALGGVKVGNTLQINSTSGILNINAVLDNLNDVQIQNPLVNQVVKFNGSQWINASVPQTINGLDDLQDVELTTPLSADQILKYNGTDWVNSSLPVASIELDDLTDVVISSPTNGQVLKYNGTEWVNGTDEGQTGNPFDQDLNTTDQVEFVSTTADEYILGGSGTPTLESETDVFLSAVGKVSIITPSPFKLASLSTSQRDALTNVENGDVIYNTTDNKFQGRANGSWVDLH